MDTWDNRFGLAFGRWERWYVFAPPFLVLAFGLVLALGHSLGQFKHASFQSQFTYKGGWNMRDLGTLGLVVMGKEMEQGRPHPVVLVVHDGMPKPKLV
jgi:hypothetical protein